MKSLRFLPYLILAVIYIAFFYRTIFSGLLPVPADTLVGLYYPWKDIYAKQFSRGVPFKNFLITDPVRQQIPWRKLAIDSWKRGRLPGWNQYAFGGTQLDANIQSGAFYPLNVIFLMMPFKYAWTILVILQPVLAGLFLYLYLRHLRMSRTASIYGAVAWSFCGFNIAWLTWGTIVQVVLWLPLALLALEKYYLAGSRRQSLFWLTLLLGSFSMQASAGHSQVALYVFVTEIFYLLYFLKSDKSKTVSIGYKSFALLLAVTCMLLLTRQYLQQFLSLYFQSDRINGRLLAEQPGWFIPPAHLFQFLVPDFFGNPATLNYWGIWNYGEMIGYAGIITIILFVLSFRQPRGRISFWNFTAVCLLVLAVKNPLSRLPFILNVPVLSGLQPTRYLAVLDFCISVSGAMALDYWLKKEHQITLLKIIIVFGFILSVLALYALYMFRVAHVTDYAVTLRNLIIPFSVLAFMALTVIYTGLKKYLLQKYITAGMILVLLLVVDLFRFGWKFTPFVAGEYFFPDSSATRYLQKQNGQFRIAAVDDRIIPPNTMAYYGIDTFSGYDSLYDLRFAEFMAALNRGKPDISGPWGFNRIITPSNLDSPLWPYTNTKFILSLDTLRRPDYHQVAVFGDTKIYAAAVWLPRYYFAQNVVPTDKNAAIKQMYETPAEKRYAFVEDYLGRLPMGIGGGDVTVLEINPDDILLKSKSDRPGFLVGVFSFNPNWKAQIDGQAVQIYRTNFLFQGIFVPAGSHDIVWKYGVN